MKKISAILMLLTIFSAVLLTSCGHKKLTDEDFAKVQINMTTKQVEKKLGKPVSIIASQTRAKSLLTKDASYLEQVLLGGDQQAVKTFVGEKTDLGKLSKTFEPEKLKEMKAIKIYQYRYRDRQNQEQTKNIYFHDNKVFWMAFE